MGEKYNENLVMKEIARCVGEYLAVAFQTLPYAKGYKGRVISGSDGSYLVHINGVTHTVHTDYLLNQGEDVTLLSLQNQNGDYAIIPTVQQILNTIGGGGS